MGKRIHEKTRIQAVQDYLKSGDSLKKVGKRHGMSSETLRKLLGDSIRKPGGLKRLSPSEAPSPVVRSKGGAFNQNKRWKKIEDETLVDAVRGGMTVEETSELLGRTAAAVYTRKHILVLKGALGERFVVPEGIKRTRRPVSEVPPQEPPVETAPEVTETNTEIPAMNTDGLSDLSLERLASIVNNYGVNLTMNISGNATTIQIEKR